MLDALARVHGTTAFELLGETVADRDAVVRAADMEPPAAGGWTYWQAGAPGRGRQALLRVHVPHGSQGDIVRVHLGEEWLYVLGGPLRSRLGDTHRLAPGNSAHFDSLPPHRIAAADRDCLRGVLYLLFEVGPWWTAEVWSPGRPVP